jgi:hypothetical protein
VLIINYSSYLSLGPIFTILSLLSSLTGCVNPWIYLTFSYDLRVALTKFLPNILKQDRSANLGKYNYAIQRIEPPLHYKIILLFLF